MGLFDKDFWSDTWDDISGAVKKAGSFIDDFAHENLKLLDPYTQLKDLWEASNPWEELWRNVGEHLEGPLWKSLNQNDLMSDDHMRYAHDSSKLIGAAAATIAGTIYGGPVGYGAAMGAMSGMGISLFNQGEHINWGNVGMAGVSGTATGAVGGAVGGYIAPYLGGVNEVGANMLQKGIYGGSVYGGSGFASAYGETGDLGFAAKFGGMAALGGGLGIAGGMGAIGGGLTALSSGLGMTMGNNDQGGGGGGGGGGNYEAPQNLAGDPNAGSGKQSRATKSVPEAEFLDGGSANWGPAGMGGVFGGLDNLRKGDSFVDTNKISDLYAQRALGGFVKV